MKKLIILLLMLSVTASKAQSVNTKSVKSLSFVELEDVSYYLNDQTELQDISQEDLVSFRHRHREKIYEYNWDNGEFIDYRVLNKTPLQDGDYFSHRDQWTVFENNGVVRRLDLNGKELSVEQVPLDEDFNTVNWKEFSHEKVSPVKSIEFDFRFVPYLSPEDIQELEYHGIKVTYKGKVMTIESADTKKIINGEDLTITTVFFDNIGEVESIETEFYILKGEQLIKTEVQSQLYRTLVDGICYNMISKISYQDIKITYETGGQYKLESSEILNPVLVFPNPMHSDFFISSSKNQVIDHIELFDISGKRIQFKMEKTSDFQYRIIPQPSNTGVYMLKYTVNNEPNVRKILKI